MDRAQGAPVVSALVSERLLAWLAVVIVAVTLCLGLGRLPLLAPDEGRNAEVAREMKESGSWLAPTYNGAVYLDKPAFFFKAVALSLAAFGNNETAARLPSAAAAVALTLLVYGFCRWVYSRRCALLAAIVVASTPLFLANARTVIFDMMLALFVCAAIFAGYLAELQEGSRRRNWYLAGAACAGVATLIKGPVGFLIPILVLLVFNRLDRRGGAWKRLLSPLNFLVFFAVTLPWFVGLCLQHPDFLRYGLLEESVKRFASGKRFHRSEPFYFYGLIVMATFLPWSFLLPQAAWRTWKERWPKNSADRLCLVWSVLVVVFFSISQSKLPGYILSVTVACGILVARVLDAALTGPEGWAGALLRKATVAFAVFCLLVAIVAASVGAGRIQALAKPLRISVEEAGGLYHAAVPVMLVLVVFAFVGAVGSYRRSAVLCFLCLALFAPMFGQTAFATLSVIFEAKAARQLSEKCAALPAGTEAVCLRCFPSGLPFYLGRTVTLISDECEELTSNYILYSITRAGKWPEKAVRASELQSWLGARTNPVCLIVPSRRREQLAALAETAGAKIEVLTASYVGLQLSPREAR